MRFLQFAALFGVLAWSLYGVFTPTTIKFPPNVAIEELGQEIRPANHSQRVPPRRPLPQKSSAAPEPFLGGTTQKLAENSPKIFAMDRASQPVLDEALEIEDSNESWTQQVGDDAKRLLSEDESISIEAKCGQTLCRLRFTKPIDSKLDWRKIDELLRPIVVGEKVFTTQVVDDLALGGMYFSANDSNLEGNVLVGEDDE